MWRAGLDTKGIAANDGDDDDWETDPDFVVSSFSVLCSCMQLEIESTADIESSLSRVKK